MNNDPIIKEIRDTRQKMLDECNGDLNTYLDSLKESETKESRPIVTKETLKKIRKMDCIQSES